MIIDESTRKVKCDYCNKISVKASGDWHTAKKASNHFCNRVCRGKHEYKRINCLCTHCNKSFIKEAIQVKKTKNNFCSRSCAATYNNTHKNHGTRRSKLEVWIEDQLTILYPNLEIYFNRKDAINSELDIYIPSLKLAFELNGIFHYEPIFGEDKLNKIQNNDQRKYQACIESNISLCIIDTSGQKYFKPKSSQKYLDIIMNIIDSV